MYDRSPAATGPPEDSLGTELTYALDDEEDPTTITVFKDDVASITTAWITMDVEFAVDPYDVA